MLLKQTGNDAAELTFPAKIEPCTMSGTTQNTNTSLPLTTAALMSTSLSSTEHQTLGSAHTSQVPAAKQGKHRTPIQTTVNKLGELVECFRALNFKGRDHFFHQIITTIPPITRSCGNAVGRGRPIASVLPMQASQKAQQDTRRDQDAVVDAAATEGSVWQPLL